MDVKLAEQYRKKLLELYDQLEKQATAEKRTPYIERMHNITTPLFTVHSGAAQHIEEALHALRSAKPPIEQAAHTTIRKQLELLRETIENHSEPHFMKVGAERVFAKPVAGDELRTAIDHGKLFRDDHAPWLHAFVIEPHVEQMFLQVDLNTLRPVLQRMGFPNAEAILFFRTRAVPSLVVPHEQIPSLRIAKLRAGIPVTAIKHRVL